MSADIERHIIGGGTVRLWIAECGQSRDIHMKDDFLL